MNAIRLSARARNWRLGSPAAVTAPLGSDPPPPGARPLPRHPLEDGRVDVEVAVDLADVVVVLEGVDEAHQAPGDLLVERHAGLRILHDLGVLELDPGLLERA